MAARAGCWWSKTTLRSMRMLLELNGMEVQAVSRASDAIEKLSWHPDFVVLDLDLAGERGEEVLHLIRDKGSPIRVAVVSGATDSGRLDAARQLAPDVVMKKPITFVSLLQWLDGG
jgi:CheY-like chemotaxis protein